MKRYPSGIMATCCIPWDAEAHPNLVATKNCGDSLSHLRSLLEDAPRLQHFLSEAGYVYGSLFGECGILASFIMYDPQFPLRLLPPYAGASDDEFHAFVRVLRERLPEWVP